ncbi:MAG TPA: hypothetical protein VF246_09170 [Acidimicrobiia bacterium]
MDKGPVDRRLSDAGLTSVQFVLAAGLGLLLFIVLANLVVVQYGRGALRSALEQGVRAGTITRSVEACEATAADVVSQLLGGAMSDGLDIECGAEGGAVVAIVDAVFQAWVPLIPDFEVTIRVQGFLEPER